MRPDQDPDVYNEARGILSGLFAHVGRQGGGGVPRGGGPAAPAGAIAELEEFLTMPVDLARIFTEMAMDLADVTLTALSEAGIVLVKGLTPA